jgi:hypothetical protein
MAQLQTTGVTGSLTVTGQIIAQSLNVQQVTSSIVYSSGSNRFGSLTSNVQEFTGSLRVTGSGNHWIVGGNVGIDTPSPTYKLQVNGTANGLYVIGANVSPFTQTIASFVYGGNNNSINVENQGGKASFQARDNTSAAMDLHINPIGGNVGIGTTAPRDVLDVVGSAILRSGYNLSWGNTYGTGVPTITGVSGSSAVLAFFPAGSTSGEKVRITSDGNVGIGTTSVNAKLHAWNSNTGANIETVRITSAYSTAGDGPLLRFTNYLSYATNPNAGEYNLAGIRAYDFAANWGGALQFLTANTTSGGGNLIAAMTINSSQNVGIGTTNATEKLTSAGNLYLDSNDPYIYWNSNYIRFKTKTNSIPVMELRGSTGGSYGSRLYMYAANDSTVGISLDSEGSSYFNGGNVGIGTTTPAYKLHVSGSSGTTIMLQSADNLGAQFRAKNTAGEFVKGIDGSGNGGWMDYDVTNSQFVTYYRTGSSGFYSIYTNGGERITVLGSNGNVGIGTTSPSQKLEIAGNISLTQGANRFLRIGSLSNYYYDLAASSDDFVINEAGTTTRFIIKYPNGNVGIGTTNPTTKLQVAGVISGSAFQLGPVQYAARRYTKTVENITTGSYTTLFNVYGDQLSSAIKVVIRGTVNSVVVDSIIDITANHSEDIIIKSQSGIYTILTIKILAATSNTEDFTVQAKINSHEPGQPLQAYVDVYPYGNEIIEFNPGSIYSTTVLEHECSPGFNHSSVGGTDYFNINNGNVGIGTTEPNATLNIVTPSDDTTGDSFKFKGSSGKEFVSISKLGFIRSRASDTNGANMHFFDNAGSKRVEVAVTSTDFSWYSDALSSTFMTFKHSNGYIGIGTTSPTATLQVVGNARIGQYANTSTNAVLDLTSGGSGYNSYADFGYWGTFDAAIWFVGYFGDDGGKFKIKDAGSGPSPVDALTISQGSRNVTISSLSGTGDRIVGTNSSGLLSSITVGSGLSLSSGTLTATGGSAGTVTGTGASTQIAYWTSTSNVTGSNGLVFSGGNVGIGTLSPSFTLDAQGGGSGLRVLSNTSYVDLALTNTSTTSYIQADGNNMRFFVAGGSNSDIVMVLDGVNNKVGIGSTSPTTAKLVISGGVAEEGLDLSTTDQYANLRVIRNSYSSIDKDLYIGYQSGAGSKLHLYSNNSETITVSGGTVGINETSPSGKLTISNDGGGSNVIFQKWRYATGADSYYLDLKQTVTDGVVRYNFSMVNNSTAYNNVLVLDRGKVGIGTTEPGHQLTIEGDQQNLKLQSSTSPANYYAEISANYNYANAFTINANGAGGVQTLMLWGDGVGLTLQGGATRPLLLQPSNGNVGIGTTSASYKLDVSGTINGLGLRGKYIPRTSSTTSTTAVTPTIDTEDVFVVTAQAQSLTINNPTGTIVNGQRFILRIKDNATPQSLTFGNLYRASTDLPLPSITLAGKTLYLGFMYNSDANRWDLIAKINNF